MTAKKPYLLEEWERENTVIDPYKLLRFITMLAALVALIKYIF